MHHRHEFVIHSLRHVEPMEVDMHKLLHTSIELFCVDDKQGYTGLQKLHDFRFARAGPEVEYNST